MDHPLTASEALVRPWRTAAYVTGTIALVELCLLLFLGGGALFGALSDRIQLAAKESVAAPEPARASKPAPAKKAAAATPVAKLPRQKTIVLVLNGNGRSGAAGAAAARVSGKGYRIGAVGNASRSDYTHSIVMYRPGFAGEGQRLGKDLGVKMVGPLDGMRASALGRAHVVFILGR